MTTQKKPKSEAEVQAEKAAATVNVHGEGSETYGSMNPPETISGPKTIKAQEAVAEAIIAAPEVPPEEGAAPVLASLEPVELSIDAPDTTVLCKGSGFTEESKIIWNGGEEPTTFVDAASVSTLVKPSTVSPDLELPFSLPVLVRTGDQETAELQFTFVAAAEPPAEPPVVDNTLPIPPQ
jgi:hypothetical protein